MSKKTMSNKHNKRGKRAHRRNPSSHPILAAFATLIVEGVAHLTLGAVAGATPGTPGWLAKQGAITLGTAGGGYALGAHLFPQSKMPILVGSVLHAFFASWAVGTAAHQFAAGAHAAQVGP